MELYDFGVRHRKRMSKKSSRKKNRKSLKKSKRVSKRKSSVALSKWRSAAKKAGYFKPGEFKKLPKKGTSEYKKIKSIYNKM